MNTLELDIGDPQVMITLSQAMRDQIYLYEILKEINKNVFKTESYMPKCTTNSKSFSDIISTVQESHIPKSKV